MMPTTHHIAICLFTVALGQVLAHGIHKSVIRTVPPREGPPPRHLPPGPPRHLPPGPPRHFPPGPPRHFPPGPPRHFPPGPPRHFPPGPPRHFPPGPPRHLRAGGTRPGIRTFVANEKKPIPKSVPSFVNVKPSLLTAKRVAHHWNDLKFKKHNKVKSVNSLGSGFPDDYPPKFLLDALTAVVDNQSDNAFLSHQYTKSMGDPKLVKSIAGFFSPLFHRNLDPDREILVTSGASQGLDTAIRAFVNPGDEVIVFEPTDFMYEPIIRLSNGIPVGVPLQVEAGKSGKHSQDWTFNISDLINSVNERTAVILLNNPNTPYGKMFNHEELGVISELAIRHNLIVISDEGQQFLDYEPQTRHIRIATLPAMWERTITITSGGKMFGSTGWRIGWSIGPAELLWGPAVVSSAETLHASTPIQLAFSIALDHELPLFKVNHQDSYTFGLKAKGHRNRDKLANVFESVGIDYIKPAAGLSICANFTKLAEKIGLTKLPDAPKKFSGYLRDYLTIDAGPVALHYLEHDYAYHQYVIRFIIIKSDEVIEELGQKIVDLANKYK